MKQICILTEEQAEELRDKQERIVSDVDIVVDLLKGQPIKNSVKDDIWVALGRIHQHCYDIEYILDSE